MLYQPIILIGRILTRVYNSGGTILREMRDLLPVPEETTGFVQALSRIRKQKCTT